VIEINESNFQEQVIDQSGRRAVLVDFWAPWCGPCKMLGPVLEKLETEFNGAFVLAKINTDENQALAAQFDVRGIPHVVLVKDGDIAGEFTGAQTESAVRRFLQQHLAAAEQDARLEDARALAAAGSFDDAIRTLKSMMEEDPGQTAAAQLLAEVCFKREAAAAPAPGDKRDAEYRRACALAAAGQFSDALAAFLRLVETDREWNEGAARKAMLQVFDLVGPRSPLAEEFRSKLAMALYR
jgi:putative thioredoxin